MIRPLYDWTLRQAAKPYAAWTLAVVSFVESSFFPIPPDVLLAPMVLARRGLAWAFAGLCTLASVLGGLAGYAIGALAFAALAEPILAAYGYADRFDTFTGWYDAWGAWIVFGAGVTPFPYKVVTIASGAVALDLWVFVIASVLSRGLRFFLVAALLWWFGPPIQAFIEKRLWLAFTVGFVLLVGGFVVLKGLI